MAYEIKLNDLYLVNLVPVATRVPIFALVPIASAEKPKFYLEHFFSSLVYAHTRAWSRLLGFFPELSFGKLCIKLKYLLAKCVVSEISHCMTSAAKQFKTEHKLNDLEFDRILAAGSRIQKYLDAYWFEYQLPLPKSVIYGYWKIFPREIPRDDMFRILARLGFYRIIITPTGREFVASSKTPLDDEELAIIALQVSRRNRRKKRDRYEPEPTN